jgi:hypothetical protein
MEYISDLDVTVVRCGGCVLCRDAKSWHREQGKHCRYSKDRSYSIHAITPSHVPLNIRTTSWLPSAADWP